MSARTNRRSTAAAIALTATITGTLLLTGCGPSGSTGTSAAPAKPSAVTVAPTDSSSSAPTSTPTDSASATPTSTAPTGGGQTPSTRPSAPRTSAAPVPVLNGTAHTGLTISNGTDYVVMNGTSVNFGTVVRDLAWSPNGSRAAFIDGAGNLVTSNPDGTGKVTVAVAPSGESWSHPTWQVTAAGDVNGVPAKNNILFAASKGGVSQLERVVASSVHGTPAVVSLYDNSGDNEAPNPTTGNVWPNAAGHIGTSVYANTADGDVYIRDDYLRQQGGVMTKGSEPDLSSDEMNIVFVRSVGGHDHLFEASTYNPAQTKDLTPNATTDYSEPVFSPDGKTIAARTPAGVVTLPANGSAAPKLISGVAGLPAYRA
ncbi:hypothetical protein P3T36_003231 [Kitasatospora sp. MAP12-15]|uniref:hypothetical protein n=1 Tax=unclassified Kitasatospora TaxID=2633591 RepID=UPI0024732AB6|nr:hypothetical protein [Kitasatospora sp. MAP12-44]MDH6111207.1 hypothetical protein [Kitasatospora sp. MAP12-44]